MRAPSHCGKALGPGSGPTSTCPTWSLHALGSLLPARDERIGRRAGDEGSFPLREGVGTRLWSRLHLPDVVTARVRLPSPSEGRAYREKGWG